MIECLTCLPCCGLPQNVVTKQVLKGHEICPSWRMLPGLVTLAACVIGIAYCIMKQTPYLYPPYGLGAFASLYHIYLGYQFKTLKSLHQSSEDLQQSNEELSNQLRALHNEGDRFRQENAEYSRTTASLTAQVSRLESTNDAKEAELQNQIAANRNLQRNIEQLEAGVQSIQTGLKEQLQEGVDNLDGFRQVLQGLQTERTGLAGLRDQIIEVLAPTRTEEYRRAADRLGKLEGSIQAAKETLPELKNLVESQRKIKDSYASLIDRAATLFTTLEERGQAFIETLGNNAEEIRAIKEELAQLLQDIKQK